MTTGYTLPLRHDVWIILGVSLIVSQLFISIGAEKDWFELFQDSSFVPDTLFVFILTSALWLYVRMVSVFLQQKYDWLEKPIARILTQVFFGIALPSVACIFIVALYFYLHYQLPLSSTSFPDYEFPFTIIVIAQFNLYYLIYYFYRKAKTQASANTAVETKKSIVGMIGRKNVPIDLQDIANAFIKNSVVYITTFSNTRLSVNYTLDDISLLLNEKDYFRANRQVILHRKSCKAFMNEANGKLLIELEPDADAPLIISQLKAAEFKKWIGAN
ncbi:LytTR family transcriptional regulator DNA-binding domain-containing protein [uncultured Imperialibacter sp.]|uniref:LytTR family transcriptional regulator DNA-binding domain-containing protein n=1 Tax=uncultured Imperialibacter sp. TaxID=1672639 RepID=UPI0030D754C8